MPERIAQGAYRKANNLAAEHPASSPENLQQAKAGAESAIRGWRGVVERGGGVGRGRQCDRQRRSGRQRADSVRIGDYVRRWRQWVRSGLDGYELAERLREGFSQYDPSGQGEQPRLTLSVGVVQVTENDDSVSLLRRAEAALDAADRRGGNRAYYHDGERCAPITAMLETMDYLS